MRRAIATSVIAVVLFIPLPAAGTEFIACWVTQEQIAGFGFHKTITRCRISGGDTVDYATDSSVPTRLYPALGTDLTGECWYYTSRPTQFVILGPQSGGAADIGYDPDPSTPGGVIAIGPTIPRCTSEPTPASDPLTEVWDYVTSYLHAPPTPDLNPRVGEGVTGMDTYLGVDVPTPHATTLASLISTIDLEIEVSAIHVDWGDGTIETFPAHDEILAGYPEGAATHLYEAKDHEGIPITVSYDWTVRWRQGGGPWQPLDAPDTTTTVSYPLYEVISVLTR